MHILTQALSWLKINAKNLKHLNVFIFAVTTWFDNCCHTYSVLNWQMKTDKHDALPDSWHFEEFLMLLLHNNHCILVQQLLCSHYAVLEAMSWLIWNVSLGDAPLPSPFRLCRAAQALLIWPQLMLCMTSLILQGQTCAEGERQPPLLSKNTYTTLRLIPNIGSPHANIPTQIQLLCCHFLLVLGNT